MFDNPSRNLRNLSRILLVVALLLAVRTCLPPSGTPNPPTEQPPSASTSPATSTAPVSEATTPTGSAALPTPAVVENQVILVGLRQDIQRVVAEYQKRGGGSQAAQLESAAFSAAQAQAPVTPTLPVLVELRQEASLDLSRVLPRPIDFPIGTPQPPIAMDLYRLAATSAMTYSVQSPVVARDLNQIAAELGVTGFGADPNYVVSSLQVGADDPWIINGGPFSLPITTTASDFTGQWALATAGIGLQRADGSRGAAATGKGVKVVVFDTSPFVLDGAGPAQRVVPMGSGGSEGSLSLTVTHPATPAPLPPLAPEGTTRREHGLYVASLAHVVAPDASLELVRVLNDDGRGDLWSLNQAIFDRLLVVTSSPGQAPLTIFNLSLGVVRPATYTEPPAIEAPLNDTDASPAIAVITETNAVASLETLMRAARDLKVLVVAAAGNDRRGKAATPMQVPADLDSVVGVGALDAAGQLACFSNQGDTWAPGGQGLPGSSPGAACQPPMEACRSELDHRHCLMGLTSTGAFAYWAGSSFATPLVTGLGALLLEEGHGVDETRAMLMPVQSSEPVSVTITSLELP